MLFDSITLAQGADITNMVVPSGASFPDASVGEMFYRTDAPNVGLYSFDGTNWIIQLNAASDIQSLLPAVGTGGTFNSVTVDSVGRVTAGSNPTTLAGYGIADGQPLDADLTAIAAIVGTSGFLKKTATNTWSLDNNTYITGNQSITLSNDLTGTGTTSISATLASTGVTAGTYGSTSTIPAFTVDAKGRILSANSLDISIPSSAIIAHQNSIIITEAQITDGSVLARNAGNETVSGVWTFSNSVSVPEPVLAAQAATKKYVDDAVLGLIWKHPADVATTGNITLSGLQTIDGVAVQDGFRVLVKNQTSTPTNGVYLANAGAWTRTTDFDQVSPIDEINSAGLFVSLGTTQASTAWTQTATVTTVGTSPMTFVQFNGGSSYSAGAGLQLTGNVFSNTGVLSTSVTAPIVNTGTSTAPIIGIAAASTSSAGSMSAADKLKLDGLSSSASLTSTQIGFGSSGDLLTGSTDFTFNNSTKTLNLNGSATIVGGAVGEDLTIKGGRGYGAGVNGGHLKLVGGGADTAGGGDVQILTGNTPTLRMSFGYTGGLALGTDRLNFGTAGQVLTSNGAAAPSWTSVASLSTSNTWTAGQRGAVSVLTYGATVTPNLALSNNFSLTATGNFTMAFPTNVLAGQSGMIAITQDATGSRVVTWASGWVAAGGTKPVLTTTANAVDYISYYVETTGRIFISMIADVK